MAYAILTMCRPFRVRRWPILFAIAFAGTGAVAAPQRFQTPASPDPERALAAARASGDPRAIIAALQALALTLTVDHPERGAQLFEEAARRARLTDGPESFTTRIMEVQLALARALGGDRAGQIDVMAVSARGAGETASTPDERAQAAAALLTAAQFADSAGRRDISDGTAALGMALLGRSDTLQRDDAADSYDIAADLALRTGRYADALFASERAVAIRALMGQSTGTASRSYGNAAGALFGLGRFGEAETMLRRSLTAADQADPPAPYLQLLALQKLARFYRETGRSGLALPLLDRALVLAQGMAKGFRYALGVEVDLAETHLDRGEPAKARPFATLSVETATRLLGAHSAERGTLLLTLGEIDLALDDIGGATQAVAEARTVYAAALAPDDPRRGDALLIAGRVTEAAGDFAHAADLYRQAIAAMRSRPIGAPERTEAQRRAALALAAAPGPDPDAMPLARAAADALARRLADRANLPGSAGNLDERERATFDAAVIVAWRTAHPAAPR